MLVIDNFLPKAELERLRDDKYWQKPISGRFVIQDYWNLASDHIIYMHTAKMMFEWGCMRDPLLKKAYNISSGIEWWTHLFPYTNVNDRGDPMEIRKGLDWHKDKDEILYKRTKEIISPLAVAVLYVHDDEEVDTMGHLELEYKTNYTQEIDPIPNRLVIFDGTKLHRVTEGTNIKKRKSLIANLWPTVILNRRGQI